MSSGGLSKWVKTCSILSKLKEVEVEVQINLNLALNYRGYNYCEPDPPGSAPDSDDLILLEVLFVMLSK